MKIEVCVPESIVKQGWNTLYYDTNKKYYICIIIHKICLFSRFLSIATASLMGLA
jgi:hypothetical protein